jgi:hypothetical protein
MDFEKMILDHVTVPKPPVTEVGWRVRRTDTTTRFEVTVDDGDTWTTTHTWDGPHTAGDIVRAGYAIFAKYPGARVTEFEKINGTWIPRIEEEEE